MRLAVGFGGEGVCEGVCGPVVFLSGVGDCSWVLCSERCGYRVRVGTRLGTRRAKACAQGPTRGLPTTTPLLWSAYVGWEGCQDRQSICLCLCPGLRSRAASSLPGGRQQIPAHPSAFRWSRQEPPQSCLEGIAVFEEAQAGGGGTAQQTVLMEAPLKTTDARREEEGGQGRACLSLCVSVGQCPTESTAAPSHVFVLMVPEQGASGLWKTPFQPRQQAHSLTPAATPSQACSLHSHTNTPTPPHPHAYLCTLTHAAHPSAPVPSQMHAPSQTPHSANTVRPRTHVTQIPIT